MRSLVQTLLLSSYKKATYLKVSDLSVEAGIIWWEHFGTSHTISLLILFCLHGLADRRFFTLAYTRCKELIIILFNNEIMIATKYRILVH